MSITGVVVGLIVWTVHQQGRIDELERKDQEHPTKTELNATAIRIDNRIADLEKQQAEHPTKAELNATAAKLETLERHVDDLDVHGTRALSERVNAIEQNNRSHDDRI